MRREEKMMGKKELSRGVVELDEGVKTVARIVGVEAKKPKKIKVGTEMPTEFLTKEGAVRIPPLPMRRDLQEWGFSRAFTRFISIQLIGVSIPKPAPSNTTAPLIKSTSVSRVPRMSCSMGE